VNDGESAQRIRSAFQPEIVLLDLGMAVMDGYEVARRLRERPEGTRMHIVAMTGWGQGEDRHRSREMGFDLHLVKPVSADMLEELLANRDRVVPEDGVLETTLETGHS
jgi:CheY-like chemotaxis protein